MLDNCEHVVDACSPAGRGPAAPLPAGADPGDEPGSPRPRRRAILPVGSTRAAGAGGGPGDGPPVRIGASVHRPGDAATSRPRSRRRRAGGDRLDLPASRRDPVRHRVGRRPGQRARRGRDRGDARRRSRPAGGELPVGVGPPADPSGDDQVERQPALRARTDVAAPPVGVRRRFQPRSRQAGVRRRRHRGLRRSRPARRPGGQVVAGDRTGPGPIPASRSHPPVRRRASRPSRGGHRGSRRPPRLVSIAGRAGRGGTDRCRPGPLARPARSRPRQPPRRPRLRPRRARWWRRPLGLRVVSVLAGAGPAHRGSRMAGGCPRPISAARPAARQGVVGAGPPGVLRRRL